MANARVFSLVATVPFSPVDFDLGKLARGEWNALTDRFRLWYLPAEEGSPIVYVMVRKFDPADGIVTYGHIVVELGKTDRTNNFTIGIMCNDDVRARAFLNSFLEIPPSFHKRSEVHIIERRWRSDPEAVMRFLANVHSAIGQARPPGTDSIPSEGKALTVKFTPPPDVMKSITSGMGAWWAR